MNMIAITEVTSEEQARDLAIDWQASLQDGPDLSYGELAEWQDYFTTLGEKFNLTEEFEENGIL